MGVLATRCVICGGELPPSRFSSTCTRRCFDAKQSLGKYPRSAAYDVLATYCGEWFTAVGVSAFLPNTSLNNVQRALLRLVDAGWVQSRAVMTVPHPLNSAVFEQHEYMVPTPGERL